MVGSSPSLPNNMPRSRFKHVSWRQRGANPWQALVHGHCLGAFARDELAAKAVADELCLTSFTELRRDSQGKRRPKSKHHHVYWHRKSKAWQVKKDGVWLGQFCQYEHAVAVIVHHTGQEESSLLKIPNQQRHPFQGQKDVALNHMNWFRCRWQAYKLPDHDAALPGDIWDLCW